MSRPRKHKRDPHGNLLLPRMYFRHGAYYLTKPGGQMVHLGRAFDDAVRAYGVKSAAKRHDAMVALIEGWREEKLPEYAASTQLDYGRMLDELAAAFVDFAVPDMTPADVYHFCSQWKDKPRSANMYRSLLALIFTYGASTEWPNDNPAAKSLTFKKRKKRDRYVEDDELAGLIEGALIARDGLRNRSGEMIALALELTYETGQRISDVLELRKADLHDEGVFFYPAKTRNSTGVRLLIEWTPKLRDLVAELKAIGVRGRSRGRGTKRVATPILSPWVVHKLDGGQYTYSGFYAAFWRARKRAGIAGATIHDLKAKSLTDTVDELEAQKRGGHARIEQTQHYRKARKVTRAKPVSGGELPVDEEIGSPSIGHTG